MRKLIFRIERKCRLAMLQRKLDIAGSKEGTRELGARIGILRLERKQFAQFRDSSVDCSELQKLARASQSMVISRSGRHVSPIIPHPIAPQVSAPGTSADNRPREGRVARWYVTAPRAVAPAGANAM